MSLFNNVFSMALQLNPMIVQQFIQYLSTVSITKVVYKITGMGTNYSFFYQYTMETDAFDFNYRYHMYYCSDYVGVDYTTCLQNYNLSSSDMDSMFYLDMILYNGDQFL